MKKIISLFLTTSLIFTMAGCGSSDNVSKVSSSEPVLIQSHDDYEEESSSVENGTGNAAENSGGNVLVAYFSWADNAVFNDNVDAVTSPSVVSPGNVEELAAWVQEETGADLFPIQVTEPYSSDWDECLERANEERREQDRPQLAQSLENFDDYDVVFLGYPNWWYGVPMAILTFLEEYDFTDKQVYLFCSHGTGGLAESVEIITRTIPDANISDNVFDCYEEDAHNSQEDIQNWVNELGY